MRKLWILLPLLLLFACTDWSAMLETTTEVATAMEPNNPNACRAAGLSECGIGLMSCSLGSCSRTKWCATASGGYCLIVEGSCWESGTGCGGCEAMVPNCPGDFLPVERQIKEVARQFCREDAVCTARSVIAPAPKK